MELMRDEQFWLWVALIWVTLAVIFAPFIGVLIQTGLKDTGFEVKKPTPTPVSPSRRLSPVQRATGRRIESVPQPDDSYAVMVDGCPVFHDVQ